MAYATLAISERTPSTAEATAISGLSFKQMTIVFNGNFQVVNNSNLLEIKMSNISLKSGSIKLFKMFVKENLSIIMSFLSFLQGWKTVFPGVQNLHKSKVESQMFIKRLTCICVSNILHQRKILPSNHFEIRICEGLPLRVLKPKSGLPENKLMGKWLEGAFEAFDKKYVSFTGIKFLLFSKNSGFNRFLFCCS